MTSAYIVSILERQL